VKERFTVQKPYEEREQWQGDALPTVPIRFPGKAGVRLVSLWDMISTPTYKIVNHAFGLQRMYDDMKRRFHEYLASSRDDSSTVVYSDTDKAGIASMNANMRPWLKDHELGASLKRLNRVIGYADDPDCHIDDLADLIGTLMETLEDELEEKMVFYIPIDDAKIYGHPEDWFPETLISFPSATYDIKEACKCYALERYTACVYHSMAVLQIGLCALAKDVGIALRFPVELAEWGDILRAIESKIEPYEHLPRADPLRQKYDNLYSGCASQFRYLKVGWRNHVAHMREVYDQNKAHTALTHVRDLMEFLSTRLHESGGIIGV
jgi:hypothetical protein